MDPSSCSTTLIANHPVLGLGAVLVVRSRIPRLGRCRHLLPYPRNGPRPRVPLILVRLAVRRWTHAVRIPPGLKPRHQCPSHFHRPPQRSSPLCVRHSTQKSPHPLPNQPRSSYRKHLQCLGVYLNFGSAHNARPKTCRGDSPHPLIAPKLPPPMCHISPGHRQSMTLCLGRLSPPVSSSIYLHPYDYL